MEVHTDAVKVVEKSADKPVQETAEKKPEADLITRVSQFKKEDTEAKEGESKEVKPPEFDFKEIDSIEDPKAKEYAEKAYKSFQKGFNQKFQELAELRKEYEQKKSETATWTPERVQGLLNDQGFVQAAQQVMKSQAPPTYEGTQEEWSALSEGDKVKFQNMENEIRMMKQQNLFNRMRQEDEQLKNKYTNYDPKAVDIITADMLQNKIQATREHLWKVIDYEGAVERAYNLGVQDGKTGIKEKVSSSTIEGTTATTTNEPLKKEENETDREYFKRIFMRNLAKSKEANIKK